MQNKKLGIGSISLALVIIAFIWSYTIFGYCLGDTILNVLGIPAWSNRATGIHYTIFYSFVFLIPAIILGAKKNNDLFSGVGKWSAIIFSVILLVIVFFMV